MEDWWDGRRISVFEKGEGLIGKRTAEDMIAIGGDDSLQYPVLSSMYFARRSRSIFMNRSRRSVFVPSGRGCAFSSALSSASFSAFCAGVRVCGYCHFAKATILLFWWMSDERSHL